MKHIAVIVLTFFIALLLTPFIVSAQTVQNDDLVSLLQDETIDEDYFATGETVSLSGTVNADAYLAGGTVFVDGTINGDLLVAGGTVTIRGTVAEDLRVMGGTVNITGNIGKNITAVGGNVHISDSATVGGSLVAGAGTLDILAPIGRGATFGAGQATIGSVINGNILAGVGTLALTNDAAINGDLTYVSDFDGNLIQAESASVSGEITHTIPVNDTGLTDKEKAAAISGVGFFVKLLSLFSSLLLGLVLLYFFPVFIQQTTDIIEKRIFPSLLLGLITYIVSPILILLLFVTLIGIPFAVILIPLIIALVFFAKIFAMMFIGRRIMKYLNQKTSVYWMFVVGVVSYGFLTSIPVFGLIVSSLSVLAGTGALLLQKKHLYKTLRSKKLV